MGTRIEDLYTESEDEDHPHACGDKSFRKRRLPYLRGSSPRVWGQVVIVCRVVKPCRIIPTRVGTSFCHRRDFKWAQDHPHACGDKNFADVSRSPIKGSSPRVWGQGCYIFTILTVGRIIPTRVGTRVLITSPQHTFKDHPHACGDKVVRAVLAGYRQGSSPRVWGQVRRTTTQALPMWIIPTRVGTRCLQ